ncbi:hypothetical protein GOP47_0007127 [Adiantum capillus-veneris]|uniref:Dehydrogenase/reductase SDR family member 12 n=1 Tax=Adiantum capillus-veneris TaxID=13818 RepID=A0A9D4ZIX8_ADICA|nr:hypothetical protein GOP47_0007127 [Adiantum capillus-veneris]
MVLIQAYRTAAFSAFGILHFSRGAFLEHMKRFNEADTRVDMTGKNCIITGSNSGIGFETAKALASRGATVYMVCRNKERGEDAVSRIKSETGNESVHLKVCDLSSLDQIKHCAKDFATSNSPLHVLVNNAGLMEHERVITTDGLELNFAVNVVGVYAMTEMLLPSLKKAAPEARVITVSSGGMYTSPLTSDLQFEEGKFDGTVQYANNKRIQVALTEKWAEDFKGTGVSFYSMHPGWADTPAVAKSLPQFKDTFQNKLRTPEQGADTVVWLATQPNEKLNSGSFYFDRMEARKHLPFCGTVYTPQLLNSIVESIKSICKLSV